MYLPVVKTGNSFKVWPVHAGNLMFCAETTYQYNDSWTNPNPSTHTSKLRNV